METPGAEAEEEEEDDEAADSDNEINSEGTQPEEVKLIKSFFIISFIYLSIYKRIRRT